MSQTQPAMPTTSPATSTKKAYSSSIGTLRRGRAPPREGRLRRHGIRFGQPEFTLTQNRLQRFPLEVTATRRKRRNRLPARGRGICMRRPCGYAIESPTDTAPDISAVKDHLRKADDARE